MSEKSKNEIEATKGKWGKMRLFEFIPPSDIKVKSETIVKEDKELIKKDMEVEKVDVVQDDNIYFKLYYDDKWILPLYIPHIYANKNIELIDVVDEITESTDQLTTLNLFILHLALAKDRDEMLYEWLETVNDIADFPVLGHNLIRTAFYYMIKTDGALYRTMLKKDEKGALIAAYDFCPNITSIFSEFIDPSTEGFDDIGKGGSGGGKGNPAMTNDIDKAESSLENLEREDEELEGSEVDGGIIGKEIKNKENFTEAVLRWRNRNIFGRK